MESLLVVILLLIPLAGLVAVWYFVCKDFARIAADKGYPDRRYFHYCFWLGLVGVLMVVAMPDRKVHIATSSTPATHSPSRSQPTVTATGSDAPRRSPEQAASVPVAFAQDPKPVVSPSAAQSAAPKADSAAAKSAGTTVAPSAATSWKCTCRALNPIGAIICDKCRSTWRCPCGKVNPRNAQRCSSCWAWRCSCGETNPASKGMCEKCGASKPR